MNVKEELNVIAGISVILMLTLATVSVAAQIHVSGSGHDKNVPTPFSILGYDLGRNGTFTPWDQIVKYNLAVANSSNRVKTFRFGYSDFGRPMIISVVTSPSNWGRMTQNQQTLKALSDPRITTPDQAQQLVQTGIPIVFVQATQHSDEPGSAEMAMELLYKLAASDDPDVLNILDNVIVIINPGQNPDGHDMWVDWHYQWANTQWSDTDPPIWSKYASHDNNRDWFAANLIENQNIEAVFQQWNPQVFEDHHEGFARIWTPPNPDVVNPNINPIVRTGWIEYGGHIDQQAATQNLPGYVSGYNTGFDMWYPGYGDSWPAFHMAYGMTFETASAYYDRIQQPSDWEVQMGVSMSQAMPWTGGWWTLRDNINYQEGATWSDLELTAKMRTEILWSYYEMGYQEVQLGKSQPPYAFIVPPSDQKDPGTMAKMLNRLILQGVEVNVATKTLTVSGSCSINLNQCYSGKVYPAGSYIIRMDQPHRGYAKTLLETQTYPTSLLDYAYGPGGTSGPLLPYDVTGWTFPMVMGVATYNVTDPGVLNVRMSLVSTVEPPPGGIVSTVMGSLTTSSPSYGYAFSHNMNNAIIAMNRLLKAGYKLYLAQRSFTSGGQSFDAGSIIVPAATGLTSTIDQIGRDLYIQVYPLNFKPTIPVYKVTKPKIGIFYGYNVWESMDEGWERWLLDHYEFDYTRLNPTSIATGKVNGTGAPLSSFNVILLPPMDESYIISGSSAIDWLGAMPPGYNSGINATGIANLKAFARAGGTIVCEDMAVQFAVNQLGIGASLVDVSSVYGPGSILHITNIANTNPIGYGYPTANGAAFWEYSYALKVRTGTALAKYDNVNPLMSGYLVDPSNVLNGKVAAAVTPLGSGNVVLLGFRVLERDQADFTFQLWFNSIYFSTETSTTLQ